MCPAEQAEARVRHADGRGRWVAVVVESGGAGVGSLSWAGPGSGGLL